MAITMAAKDIFHEAVRKGLKKEGWVITDDPLKLQVDGVEMYSDRSPYPYNCSSFST